MSNSKRIAARVLSVLSSAAYADELGYGVEVSDGYYETEYLILRAGKKAEDSEEQIRKPRDEKRVHQQTGAEKCLRPLPGGLPVRASRRGTVSQ